MENSIPPTPLPAGSYFPVDLLGWPIGGLEQGWDLDPITSFEHDAFQPNSPFSPPTSRSHFELQPAELDHTLGLGLCRPHTFPENSLGGNSLPDLSLSTQLHCPEEIPISWSTPSIHNEHWVRNTSRVYGDDGGSHINSSQESVSRHYLNDELVNGHRDAGAAQQAQSHRIYHTVDRRSRSGLPRRRSRYSLRKSGPGVTPIFIPNSPSALDPMQRWRESPPEDEPASMSAVINALKIAPTENSYSKDHSNQNRPRSRGHDSFRGYRRPPSVASSQSGASSSSRQSATSIRSARSARSAISDPLASWTQPSHGSVRKNQPEKTKGTNSDKRRIFCCTFCCDRFKSKYDWSRHEKSLHLNLESWICAPHGGSVLSPLTGRQHCAFCNSLDPNSQHLSEHNHQVCSEGNRTFRRKDHLTQHLRLTHHLDVMPLIDDWRANIPVVVSRCGFCDQNLSSWEERVDHLAAHFRKGLTMEDWRGDHGFSPQITAQIAKALPPYLIGSESRSVVPFSATNPHAQDHFAQISMRAELDANINEQDEEGLSSSLRNLQAGDAPLNTFTEILTLHLSRYARRQLEQGTMPTDEDFQQESRRVLYDCEDSWNQTIADNPEWLYAFRRQHCDTVE